VRGRLPDAGRDDFGAPGTFGPPPGLEGGAFDDEERGPSGALGVPERRALRATSAPNARIGEVGATAELGGAGRWSGSAVTTGSWDAEGARPSGTV